MVSEEYNIGNPKYTHTHTWIINIFNYLISDEKINYLAPSIIDHEKIFLHRK